MVYTDLTRLAMKIAYKAHEGQTDRQGVPYIYHPVHVAEQMDTEDECVVALLHDVVEDSDVTFEDLKDYGFTEKQIEAVRLLTHIPIEGLVSKEDRDKDYFEYVSRIKPNPLARKVKLADLDHNSDRSRLIKITEKDEERYIKYEKAKEILR